MKNEKALPLFSALFWLIAVPFVLLLVHEVGVVNAQGSSSNYRINESFIGPGGVLDSSSTSYQFQSGQQSVGNTGVGNGSSTNFQTQLGATTTNDPRLECAITSSAINFGNLSTSVAATGTATFRVLNYTAYGYVVNIAGSPPTNSGHALANMSSTGPSVTGTEQFGINLVANTSPTTFGADPVQVPDNTFSFGVAAANYNTANNFRYVSGEAIASGPKSSGQTDYTISYIANVSTTTPGGQYGGNQVIICTGTY